MPFVPAYIKLAAREVLQEVYAGKRAVPTSSVGVGLTSILTANEAINILLKKKEITVAPRYLYLDLMDQRFIVGTCRQRTLQTIRSKYKLNKMKIWRKKMSAQNNKVQKLKYKTIEIPQLTAASPAT